MFLAKKNSLVKIVEKTIDSNKMLHFNDKVLVAVSGGSDSIALLHIMHILSDKYGIILGIAHVNHKLRGSCSLRDELFVKEIAVKLNIPYYSIGADVLKVKKGLKLTIEEAARKIRYAFFRKIMFKHSYSKVALGHHIDDNAESFLMFLLRGTGLKGLSGISPVRDGCFIRPLFQVRKAQLLDFLLHKNLNYVNDESNFNLAFTRNKVRYSLIPFLAKFFNPRIIDTINRTAFILGAENRYLDKLTSIEYERIITSKNKKISFSISLFNKLDISIKRRIVRKALFILIGSLKKITFAHIEATIALASNVSGNKLIYLPNSIMVKRKYEKIEIQNVFGAEVTSSKEFRLLVFAGDLFNRRNSTLTLVHDKYFFKFDTIKYEKSILWNGIDKNTAFLDLDCLSFPIIIRYAVRGDKFNPLGLRGSQKLKKYFINKKISLDKRSRALVLDDNGDIIWLVMHEICNYAKITEATKKILKIEFRLLKL